MKYDDKLADIEQGLCPFCNLKDNMIVNEYETAIMTIARAPYHPDHILVMPRRHVESYLRLDASEYEEIQALCRHGIAMLKAMGYDNMSVLVREGMAAGKSIPHLHYHIIPATLIGDLDHEEEQREYYNDEKCAEAINRLEKADKKVANKRMKKIKNHKFKK